MALATPDDLKLYVRDWGQVSEARLLTGYDDDDTLD